jgi:ribose-phosphate pyrophosphokinase
MIWLNGEELHFNQFPNGETKMNESEIRSCITRQGNMVDNLVKFQYRDDSDLIKLMFVKKYLDTQKNGIGFHNNELLITYMPYSRMDRSENGSAFTLKYVCEFINSLNFDRVTVIEPHSDVTPALLNNCESRFISVEIFNKVVEEIGFNKECDYVYFPDATSHKRYSSKIGNGYKELIGLKKRDFATGQIVGLNIIGEIDRVGFKVVMIDDLSSMGTTFYKGAEKLKEMGASEIYLVVGHCEDTIYKGNIFKTNLINRVYTTDSILTNFDNDRLVVRRL